MTCPESTFYHDVNGRRYSSAGLTVRTMTEYKATVRKAYGSLRGVTFGTVTCFDCHRKACNTC